LKEYKAALCLQGFGFHFFQWCLLKKGPSVSKDEVLVDEWGG
jgi:hypothetical protein